MKPRWIAITAIATGLVCGLCAAILFLPENGKMQEESIGVSATVPDHGQGTTRNRQPQSPPVSISSTETTTDIVSILPSIVAQDTLDAAFASKSDWTVKPGTRILLIPHHLIAAREIASLVSAAPKPSVAFLVTPDHFGNCKAIACLADIGSGQAELSAHGLETVKLQTFNGEHAVTGLAPFLERAWGTDVKIVPIMVKPDATEEQTLPIIEAIIAALRKDPHALLVASIDASHYQPAEVADFHDILTQDVISSLADKEVERAEIDAPAVLRVALKTARDLSLGDVTVQAHTNSLRLMQAQTSTDSTSHFLVSFAPGNIKPQSDVTLLFVGDMMFDRNVAARSRAAGSLDYPFQKIRGQEDRFFRGQDAVIGNLEGPVTTKRLPPDKGNVDFMFDPKVPAMLKQIGFDVVSQANNHTLDQGRLAADQSRASVRMASVGVFGDQILDDEAHALTFIERRGRKIALVGFNVTDHQLDKQAAAQDIASAKKQADYTVIFMHWGNEYQAKPNATQIGLAHWFIDQGVDAVIGGHPHWMQSVEVYKDKPIAYSLGNFIFDQDFSLETRSGLVVGLALSPQGAELHLYPIQIDQSQPRLLTGQERQSRLDRLASISDSSLSSAIKQGTITINN